MARFNTMATRRRRADEKAVEQAEVAFEAIRYDVDGPVATITLNRPDAANAQSSQMLEELDRPRSTWPTPTTPSAS